MKTPSMIQEMTKKGKRRISEAELKRNRENWFKNASEEDLRLHEQNRLDMEAAIERAKKEEDEERKKRLKKRGKKALKKKG
tara:strand:- start:2083 stop:2325 length:243 start_codon:yes stop_codon:yes gene_type:complete